MHTFNHYVRRRTRTRSLAREFKAKVRQRHPTSDSCSLAISLKLPPPPATTMRIYNQTAHCLLQFCYLPPASDRRFASPYITTTQKNTSRPTLSNFFHYRACRIAATLILLLCCVSAEMIFCLQFFGWQFSLPVALENCENYNGKDACRCLALAAFLFLFFFCILPVALKAALTKARERKSDTAKKQH